MSKTKISYLALLLLLTGVLSGCGLTVKTGANSTASGANDGGIYRTDNKGANWLQKTLLATVSGRPGNFNALNVSALAMDPVDAKAIYVGVVGEGLLYSYDRGDSWQRAASLGQVTINALAVDPTFHCTLYAAHSNKISKSLDCGRTWAPIYYDNDSKIIMNAIVVNPKLSSEVWLGTSRGDVMKSLNRGESWQLVNRFTKPVAGIYFSPFNVRVMAVPLEANSVNFTKDGGNSWEKFDDALKEIKGATNYRAFTFSGVIDGGMFLASNQGLLSSTDFGKTWKEIPLLTPEPNTKINAIAVNPTNDNELYYVTNTTFYRSIDGGQNWITKKLPSTRPAIGLLVDPTQPNTIYLTVRLNKK
ncbi:MAG: YCF48-related protein [Candidatus Falkowbacteria bacterium]